MEPGDVRPTGPHDQDTTHVVTSNQGFGFFVPSIRPPSLATPSGAAICDDSSYTPHAPR